MNRFIVMSSLVFASCGGGTGFYCTTLSRPASSEGATVCSRTVQGCEETRDRYSQFNASQCAHQQVAVCFTTVFANRMGQEDFCFDSHAKCRLERNRAARREDLKSRQFGPCQELRSRLTPAPRTRTATR